MRPPTLRDEPASKRACLAVRERLVAYTTVAELASKHLSHAEVVQDAIDSEGAFTASSVTLEAILAVKKTGTIQKRASSLRMYAAWFSTTGRQADSFFSEPAVFAYLVHLHADKAPATRAAALREAVNFFGGTFNLNVSAISASGRIRGMSCKLLRTRGEVRQRKPLTVKMVIALEKVLADNAASANSDALHAGTALFAVFARARVGDLRRCSVEPVLDMTDDNLTGYIETRFAEHKSARPGSRRALPIVAAAFGLTGIPWASLWLEARAAAGVSAPDSGSLTPALGVGLNWLKVAYLTPEFAAAFRGILLKSGFSHDDLDNIGAHSLKATCLSWSAKYGLDRETRRMLGYHAVPGDRSMDAYARAPLAGPLRKLDGVLDGIREKSFFPDSTASGLFVTPASSTSTIARASRSPSPTSSSSSSSSSSCSSADDPATIHKIEWKGKMVINAATGYVHAVGEMGKLLCGKAPHNLTEILELPVDAHFCKKCKQKF